MCCRSLIATTHSAKHFMNLISRFKSLLGKPQKIVHLENLVLYGRSYISQFASLDRTAHSPDVHHSVILSTRQEQGLADKGQRSYWSGVARELLQRQGMR